MTLRYEVKPALSDSEIKPLFKAAWSSEGNASYEPILARSLTYVGAYAEDSLVGFVNVAWDGGVHAFLLDTTVHPDYQRRGVGRKLVRCAVREAQLLGCSWLHVDYEVHLHTFYQQCGFVETRAGLIDLSL